jgi:lipopolysaccharide export system protein LptA
MKRSLSTLALLLALAGHHSAQPAPSPAALTTTPVPTVITAGYAEVWTGPTDLETFALFKENVVVTGTNLRITCDRIDATLAGKNETPAPTTGTAQNIERFKTIVATGKVRIIQGGREANCERAEVFPREGKIVLTGQPVVQDHGGGFTWIGEPMTLLKNERRVFGPNTKIILPEIKDLGFDKNTPLPKPAETDAAPAAK